MKRRASAKQTQRTGVEPGIGEVAGGRWGGLRNESFARQRPFQLASFQQDSPQ